MCATSLGFFVPSCSTAASLYFTELLFQKEKIEDRTIQHIPFINLENMEGRKAIGKVLALKKGSRLKIYRTCLAT